jgi:Rps23 Pro-64 3,4-dihydroxylase Tpa1-like proline 4-hydroxylase
MNSVDSILVKRLEGIDIHKILNSYPEESWVQGGIAKSRYKYMDGLTKGTDLRNACSTMPCNVLQSFIDNTVDPIVDKYAKDNNISFFKKDYQLVRYTEGQFFKEHTDATEEFPRKVSVLLYLNDDYSGGEIIFTRFGMSIKPKKNTLILFPSSENFSHLAEPVKSGTKYVVVGFGSDV